jgi:tRNA(Ile)-lysidine synthase
MSALPDIAQATALRHHMLPDGSVTLALVSGGADSMALLRLLASGALGEVAGLSALHVNHELRGADADADEEFVVRACDELGVACRAVRFDVAGYAAAEGLNLEDAGRRIRYRFAGDELDARCRALGISAHRGRIAVAHTADDRLETFLVRLVTGAGTGGLGSIAAVRDRIVRPLIDARRSDVIAYLESCGQAWREDATNSDTARQRAWVRHELLPLIESQSPSFGATAMRTMTLLADDDALLAEMADAFVRDFARVEAGALVFERSFMAALSRPMARRVMREAVLRTFPEASRLEFEHVEALVSGIGQECFARDLPFGLRAEAEYATLRVSRREKAAGSVIPGLLELPGRLELGAGGVLESSVGDRGRIARGPNRVSIDADAVAWPLVVDAWRDGDRMRPLGLGGSRKLSDVLVDARIPRRLRAATPVVRSGADVVWVAGVMLADGCRVTDATRRVADIEWYAPEGDGTAADELTEED